MSPSKLLSLPLIVVPLTLLLAPATASAHCQVPCGIYDDHARVHGMLEDVTTIAKAVKNIHELSGKTDAQSLNQAVRWVNTKERHADRIIETVSQYFLTQKIKPAKASDKAAYARYLELLTAHHAVMKAAMKAQQTVDAGAVSALRDRVKALERYWPKRK